MLAAGSRELQSYDRCLERGRCSSPPTSDGHVFLCPVAQQDQCSLREQRNSPRRRNRSQAIRVAQLRRVDDLTNSVGVAEDQLGQVQTSCVGHALQASPTFSATSGAPARSSSPRAHTRATHHHVRRRRRTTFPVSTCYSATPPEGNDQRALGRSSPLGWDEPDAAMTEVRGSGVVPRGRNVRTSLTPAPWGHTQSERHRRYS